MQRVWLLLGCHPPASRRPPPPAQLSGSASTPARDLLQVLCPSQWVLLHTRGLVGTFFCPLPGRRSPLRIQVCPCKPCLGGPGDLEGSQSSTSPLILSTELPAITYPLPSVPIPPVPRRQLHELSTGLPSHAQTCSFGRISRTRK